MAIAPRVRGPCRRSSAVAQARVAALQGFDRLTPSNNSRLLPAPPDRLRLPQARKVRIQVHPLRVETSLPLGKRINRRAHLTTPTKASSKALLTPWKKCPKKTLRAKIEVATLRVRARILERPILTRCLGPREDSESHGTYLPLSWSEPWPMLHRTTAAAPVDNHRAASNVECCVRVQPHGDLLALNILVLTSRGSLGRDRATNRHRVGSRPFRVTLKDNYKAFRLAAVVSH